MRCLISLLLIILLLPIGSARAELRSKTFTANGLCDGHDQVSILAEPWESAPIAIVGVAVGLELDVPTPNAYVFAGNSYVPDVMALRIGAGSESVMYPAGHAFPFPGLGPEPP